MPGPARLRAIIPRRRIESEAILPRLNKWFKEVGEEFKKEMQEYAPPKVGSTYIRTGNYGEGWAVAPVIITPYTVRVENNMPGAKRNYARFVGGPLRYSGGTRQHPMHRATGWKSQTIVGPKVVREKLPKLEKYLLPYARV